MINDTIIAPATIPGTGAITVVRLSGEDSWRYADELIRLKRGQIRESVPNTAHYGEIFRPDGELLDEVIVTLFRAPASYTGEDSVEISLHASSYIAGEVVRLFQERGCRYAEPGEFTRRAFLNGKMDLSQAEAVADLIASTTAATHRVAMNQLRGGVSKELSLIRAQLLEMASLLELELDFSEEDVEFADRSRLLSLVDAALTHIRALLDTYRWGNAIRSGIPTAIVGGPNAGKSSLLNLLLGEERAIVSPIAGTTRDSIEENLRIGESLFRLIDTAGIREAKDAIEKMGIERSLHKICEADIVIAVLDSSRDEIDLLNNLTDLINRVNHEEQKLLVLLNKCDLWENDSYNKIVTSINKYVSRIEYKVIAFPFSAKTSLGLSELKRELQAISKEFLPNENSTFITNARHYEALGRSRDYLTSVRQALASGSIPSDLIAEDLRLATEMLGQITGDTISPDEVMGNIFSHFCIGK